MATQWGRKETIIWPPHVPIMSYSAVAAALLCTLFFMWQQLNRGMSPLQQSYITEYARSLAGSPFKAHQNYRLVWLGGERTKPRLAMPVDLTTNGKTALPSGKVVPIGISELATLQGYRWFFRAQAQKFPDAQMHRWLRGAVYNDEGIPELFRASFLEGAGVLALMLWFAIPRDLRRFRQLKYGRVLRGPVMMTPQEFTAAHKDKVPLSVRYERLKTFPQRIPTITLPRISRAMFRGKPVLAKYRPLLPSVTRKPGANPVRGIGFKTTEQRKMMRIPERKESQHIQIMGDTGVGKTQLIMQILRQIRERGDSAIVYDPACEYVQRFYDKDRGDIILNPLDKRCPYWGPAQEMESPAEADAIASSLYSPATDAKDEFFHQTPAQIFAHMLKRGPSPKQLAEWMSDADKLEELVKGTEMSFYIDRKAGPQRGGVLASLGLVAKSFRLLPERDQTQTTWNARTWAKERKGWIFITSRPPERETLRPLHSLWIDLLVMRLLSAPQPGQRHVWFVIDELASLQKLPQLHTAITENRKSKNPLVLGFQGKAQLEVIYGHLAEVMLSQPATKIFMKTAEPKAAEWISEAIGKVEIERMKETKFDGSRSGKNFTVDRQIEPLVMGSEISGLDDRHAYLKLGNNVARFDFNYLDLQTPTPGFILRNSAEGTLTFDPDTLEPIQPPPSPNAPEPPQGTKESEHSPHPPKAPVAGAPRTESPAHEKKPSLIPWPSKSSTEAQSGEKTLLDSGTEPEPVPESAVAARQADVPEEDEELEVEGPSFVMEH